jgi:hypothetical protein
VGSGWCSGRTRLCCPQSQATKKTGKYPSLTCPGQPAASFFSLRARIFFLRSDKYEPKKVPFGGFHSLKYSTVSSLAMGFEFFGLHMIPRRAPLGTSPACNQ